MAGNASNKRTATEPAPETRASSRVRMASGKQREINAQVESDAQKRLELLERQLAQQKRKNQKLTEFIQDSRGDVEEDLGPESEEVDDEESPMQFSSSIRSKGVVDLQPKLKARKATDPPPIHNAARHQPEQRQLATTLTTSVNHAQLASPLPPPPLPHHGSRDSNDRSRSPSLQSDAPRPLNKARVRMKAKDYPEHQATILAATRSYYVRMWTGDPFPNDQLQTRWAMDSWDDVSDGQPVPDPGILHYVTKRDSNARTLLKDCVRKLIVSHYQLKNSGKPEAIRSNVDRVKSLLENATFHSKVVKGVSRLFEHRIIRATISEMWFSDGIESYGVKYAEHFNPISLSTIALVTTMIEFCLNEWKTGTFVRQQLHEPSLKEKYTGHIKDVLRWDGLAPEVTKNIRQKIFDDLHGFAAPAEATASGISRVGNALMELAAADLAARTGSSDVESYESDQAGEY